MKMKETIKEKAIRKMVEWIVDIFMPDPFGGPKMKRSMKKELKTERKGFEEQLK